MKTYANTPKHTPTSNQSDTDLIPFIEYFNDRREHEVYIILSAVFPAKLEPPPYEIIYIILSADWPAKLELYI